ncbi:MAG: DegV family protein [Lachnospiraceae bacterium]|nr:DegV family protein [Lachnospiraceae bacterium]
MDEKFHLFSDGSCDLPPELTREKNITVVPFYVSFGDEPYQKEIKEIGIREFYQRMVDEPGIYPKSSMPSAQDYMEAFLPVAAQGIPIICICITTKFSGSMQSALNAREMLLEDYPDAQITVIDATVNTVLQGLYVLEAARLRDSGADCQTAVRRLEEIKSSGRIFFTVGDIEYLKHGGRIGKVAGIAGSVLKIKPLITLKEGEIFPSGIARSRRKSMEKTMELIEEYLDRQSEPIGHFSLAVGYGFDCEEAVSYRDMVLKALKEKYGLNELPIYQIGATIGVHTGPYPLGLGIIKRSIV